MALFCKNNEKKENCCNSSDYPNLSAYKGVFATLTALFAKYTGGGQSGWFAFVREPLSIVFWNAETKQWDSFNGGGQLILEEVSEADIENLNWS